MVKYYEAGGQRAALRKNGAVSYLFGDHLGSTTVTANGASGERTAELWYKPWGENRGTPVSATPTKRRFTGQVLDNVAGGLYFYNARYYDPALGRFTQADTLIPQPQNPQALNRYSYALGNPLRFTDPSGHRVCEGAVNCDGGDPPFSPPPAPTYSGPCISVVCLPTPIPTPGMIIPGIPGSQWVAPTATPYAGAWIEPGGPWTPTPTPHPYVPPMERINKPATLWGIGQALYLDIPALVEKYSGTVIRAGGRSLNYAPPGLMTTLGYAASVGPNVVQHLQQGENLTSFELLTDVVVDSGGWALTLGTGPALSVTGASFGSAAPPAGPVIGGIVGYLVGTVGVSLYWDIQIAPAIRPTVRSWFGN
ncbi:MAG: RHS repeat-associated core domain-containing protein [Anaerolineae bacterium]